MNHLPPDASTWSEARFQLAHALSTQCPPEYGESIAITGSVSRGMADQFSDLELFFLVDELHPVEVYQDWLRQAGAEVQTAEAAFEPGALWTKSWYQGVFLEAGWHQWSHLSSRLQSVLEVQTIGHWEMATVWHMADAVAVRASPRLASWQETLIHYPDALAQRLIADSVDKWCAPHWWPGSVINLWPLAYREARLELAGYLLFEVETALRIIFAHNHRWEPDWKWLAPESRRLRQVPDQLVERVNAVFALDDPQQGVRTCLELLRDTLALLAETKPVEVARQRLQEALDPRPLVPGS